MKCPKCRSRRTHETENKLYCDYCKAFFVLPLLKGGQGRTVENIKLDSAMTKVFIVLALLLTVFGGIAMCQS